jgi:hypothetical protein
MSGFSHVVKELTFGVAVGISARVVWWREFKFVKVPIPAPLVSLLAPWRPRRKRDAPDLVITKPRSTDRLLWCDERC